MEQSKPRFMDTNMAVLLAAALLIKAFSFFGGFIESWYSSSAYQYISGLLRIITGWLPFSSGDVLYAAAGIWLMVKLFKSIRALVKRRVTKTSFLLGLKKSMVIILWVYIIFNIFWGFNYDRLGIAYQLRLQPVNYSTEDLKQLTDSLIEKVNASRKILGGSNFQYPSYAEIFAETKSAYDSAEKKFPFLYYGHTSIKSSLYGELGNYMGFLGYYNPFTGEAQVNTTVPAFVIPYTACHEVAHQVGYGSESEANFVGYLTAKNSSDNIFHYSVYFDLFAYANGELFQRDSVAAKENYRMLDTLVKLDIKKYRQFLLDHKNPVEPVIRMFYGEYLKANKQPAGIDTYDEVVSWLIAYRKKYGDL